LIIIEPEDCEAWQMPEGLLLIGRLDPFAAQGFVDLLPQKFLPPRSRPVPGIFKQMAGTSVFKVYEGEAVKSERELKTGDAVKIPPQTPHSLENRTQDKCVVYWKFDGNVEEDFEKLKQTLSKLTFQAREKSGYKDLFEQHSRRRQEDAQVLGDY